MASGRSCRRSALEHALARPDGSGESRTLLQRDRESTAGYFLGDSKRIVFQGRDAKTGEHIFVQDVAGGPPRPVARRASGSYPAVT